MSITIIQNANVLDVRTGDYQPDSSITIEDDRIVRVAETPETVNAERIIDAGGDVVMPGLIDAHVHAYLTTFDFREMSGKPFTLHTIEAAKVLEGMLQRGFTTVRDAAGADRGLASAVQRGLVKGPRMFISGHALSQTGGHGDLRAPSDSVQICACGAHTSWLSHIVDGVPAALAATRRELRDGADQIKIMASGGVASPADPLMSTQFTVEEIEAIAGEAKDWGTYAMAHAYSPEAITRAVKAGVRTIEHGNLLDKDSADLMHAHDAFLVPTLVTYYTMQEIGRQFGLPEGNLKKLGEVLEAGMQSLEIAKKSNVKMGYGTDLIGAAHKDQNREFELRSEVLSPLEIIQSATIVNARILNREEELGAVEPGAFADLIVVRGDPVRDISVLARPEETIRMVMKAGDIYRDLSL